MKRTLTLAAAALVLLPAVAVGGGAAAQAAAAPGSDAPQVFMTNFESEQARLLWTAGGDATEAKTLGAVTGDNGCGDGGGAYGALRSYNPDITRKGREGERNIPHPVATWAQAGFTVAGSGLFDVKVTWNARSVKDCEDCIPAAYVGDSPAVSGGDFAFVGTLGNGWQQFRYEEQVRFNSEHGTSGDNRLYVALGWMGGNATTGLDCITVTATKVRGATEDQTGGNFYYNFEAGLDPWGYDVESGFGLLEQGHGQNGCPDLSGHMYASIKNMPGPPPTSNDGDPLDHDVIPIPREPALYMIAPFFSARAQVSHVELDWASKDIDQCQGCTQLVYVGDDPYPRRTDFKRMSDGFKQEWAANHIEMDLNIGPASRMYVALGWEGPPGEQPEIPRNVGFDCVAVRIHPVDN